MKSFSNNPIHERFGHRCYHYSLEGIIRYDPNADKRKSNPYWCIVDVDTEVTRYYRELFKKKFGIILYKPAFDAHVSVLRGEDEFTTKMQEDWKYLDNKEVEVWYDPNIYWNEQHVWLNTYCQEYFDIREHYEVESWNTHNFSHLTIGKFRP